MADTYTRTTFAAANVFLLFDRKPIAVPTQAFGHDIDTIYALIACTILPLDPVAMALEKWYNEYRRGPIETVWIPITRIAAAFEQSLLISELLIPT